MENGKISTSSLLLVLILILSTLGPAVLAAAKREGERRPPGPILLVNKGKIEAGYPLHGKPHFTIELEIAGGKNPFISVERYGRGTSTIIVKGESPVSIRLRTYRRVLRQLNITLNPFQTFTPAAGVEYDNNTRTITLEEVGTQAKMDLGYGRLISPANLIHKTTIHVVYGSERANIPVIVLDDFLYQQLESEAVKYNALSYLAFLSNLMGEVSRSKNRTREDSIMLVLAIPVKGYKVEWDLGSMSYRIPAPFSACKAKQVKNIRIVEEEVSAILNEIGIPKKNLSRLASSLRGMFLMVNKSLSGLLRGEADPNLALEQLSNGIHNSLGEILNAMPEDLEREMDEEKLVGKIREYMNRGLPKVYSAYSELTNLYEYEECDVPWKQYYTGPILLIMSLATLILLMLTITLWGTRHRKASLVVALLFILMLMWTSGIAVNYGWHVSLTP